MERNPFDAFDEPQPASASGNPFDAFDATQPVAPPALAVDPAAISNAPPRAELVAPGSIPGSPVSDGAAALGLGTARSIIPAFLGGGAAVATGAGLTATGVGAPVGIPLSIIAAFTAGYGARVGQDKLIPPDEEEQRLARENPTLYNTIPAIATMPLGGGKFGVQNFRDLGTALSASRAGRVLTEAEKAAAISAGTQVGINAAIPAAARAYNVSQGGEFGVGDYLLELGAAPFVGGKSYRPIQAVQDAASTVGFRVGSGASSAARAAARFAGLRPRPTAAGEVNAPVAQYNGVELVRPEDLPIAVWQQLTDEGRANAVLDARARAAAAAAAQQAAPQPEPTPMSPPRPTQEVLPVDQTATATPEAAPGTSISLENQRIVDAWQKARPKRQDFNSEDEYQKAYKKWFNADLKDFGPTIPEATPAATPEVAPAPAPAPEAAPAPRPYTQPGSPERQRQLDAWQNARPEREAFKSDAEYEAAYRNWMNADLNDFGPAAPEAAPTTTAEAPAPLPPRVTSDTEAMLRRDAETKAELERLARENQNVQPPQEGRRQAQAPKPAAPRPAATPEPLPQTQAEATLPPTPKPTPQAEAPAPKPAPTARPAQTEIPGAEDAFNLAPEQTRAPAPEATADTTPDLVQPTEPSYVGPARKRLADLEAQGKGESTEAVGLREVIRGSKPAATPEAAPAAEATPAPQEAAPTPKPARLVKGKPSDIEAKIDAKKKQVETQQKRVTEADENQAMEDDSPASQRRTKKEEEKLRRLENELKELEAEAKRSPDKNTLEPDQAVEPVDVQRARKYIEEQSQRGRPQSRRKLREAEEVVEQYETDSAARAPGNKLGDSEIADVSDDTLTEIADGYANRENAGDTLTPEESQHKQQVEKELLRRFQTDEADVEGELSDTQRLVDQGKDAIDKGFFLPRLPKQYGADQIAGYLGNVSKRLQRTLFRNPPGIKIKKNPTREEIEAARRAADAMVGRWHESAGDGVTTYSDATTNSDEAVNAFIQALNEQGTIKESGLVPRRYKTIAEDIAAEGQPPVRDTDEAMPDVEVDEATGATVRTEEVDAVDAAEANLAGRDDTPIGVMPKNLDDGQGGRTLPPDKNGEGGIVKILDDSADDILGKPGEGRMHSVSPPVIAAMVWRTARAMQKGAVDATKGFASWSKGFVKTYGGNFKAYAQYVWDAAKSAYQAGFVNFKPRFLAGIAERANQVADRNKFSAAAQELNALIFNRPGGRASGEGLGAAARIESAQARVRNKLSALSAKFREKINEMSQSEKVMFNRLVRQIHEGTVPMPKGWVGEYVRDMRDILRNDPDAGLLAQQKVGIEINDAGETYFPRRLDRNRVEAREAEFVAAAAKAYKKQWERLNAKERLELFPELGDGTTVQPLNDAFFEAKAREYYNRVVERITDSDLLPLFDRAEGTKPRVTKNREFNNAEAALMDDFYVDDYLGAIEEYLGSAARRKVSAEVVGPGGEKLADISKRMAAEGVRSSDRQELREYLKKSIGIGRQAESQATAAFFDATGFIQGAAFLGKSYWNNLVQEPLALAVRRSTMPFGLDTPINILKTYTTTYTTFLKDIARLNPEQTRRYRELVGKDPAFARSLDETLSEELGLNSFNDPSFYARTTGDFGRDATGLPRVRELTNRIFDVNLLSPTEAAKVTASVRAARAFLADNLRFASGQSKIQKLFQSKGIDIGGQKTAKLYLKELGVKEADIPSLLKFVDDLDAARASGGDEAVIKLISSNDPMAVKYRESVTAFSRQSSVKPSRATKIASQDEAWGRMYLQLRGFSYEFEQSINFRRFSLMKEALVGKNYGLYDRAVMSGPLLMSPVTVAGTLAKFAIVYMLYPSKGTEKWEKESTAKKIVGAASYEGLFGPIVESALKADRGQIPGGIAAQTAFDLGSAGMQAAFGDSKSNAPERNLAKQGYRNVLKPAAGAASTMLPRPVGMAANVAMGSTEPEREFVDTVAGKEKKGSSKDKKGTGRGY